MSGPLAAACTLARVALAEWLRAAADRIDPRGILLAEVLPVSPRRASPARAVAGQRQADVPVARPWVKPPDAMR